MKGSEVTIFITALSDSFIQFATTSMNFVHFSLHTKAGLFERQEYV